MTALRVGTGYDVHKFSENRKLIIGGLDIDYEKGLMGHSDADVLVHAVMDALLGAAGLRDIGFYFPDNDSAYKDIDSCVLLDRVYNMLKERSYRVVNIDSVIICEEPKLKDYIELMKEKIASHLDIDKDCVGIKATTTEKLGFEGRKEGIAAQAVALIEKI